MNCVFSIFAYILIATGVTERPRQVHTIVPPTRFCSVSACQAAGTTMTRELAATTRVRNVSFICLEVPL